MPFEKLKSEQRFKSYAIINVTRQGELIWFGGFNFLTAEILSTAIAEKGYKCKEIRYIYNPNRESNKNIYTYIPTSGTAQASP